MCFVTDKSKIKIARKDIECYKQMNIRRNNNGNYYSVSCYIEFKYEFNKTYSNKSKFILFLRWLVNLYVSNEAYHSYTIPEGTNVKCIIPKGSLYLINEEGTEYVSTSIKILKPNWL